MGERSIYPASVSLGFTQRLLNSMLFCSSFFVFTDTFASPLIARLSDTRVLIERWRTSQTKRSFLLISFRWGPSSLVRRRSRNQVTTINHDSSMRRARGLIIRLRFHSLIRFGAIRARILLRCRRNWKKNRSPR